MILVSLDTATGYVFRYTCNRGDRPRISHVGRLQGEENPAGAIWSFREYPPNCCARKRPLPLLMEV